MKIETWATLDFVGRVTARLEIQSADGVWWGRKEYVRGMLYELTIRNSAGVQERLVLIPDQPFVQDKQFNHGSSFVFVSEDNIVEGPDETARPEVPSG